MGRWTLSSSAEPLWRIASETPNRYSPRKDYRTKETVVTHTKESNLERILELPWRSSR